MLLMQSVVISSTFWPAIKNLISFCFFYSSAGLAVYCHSATMGPEPDYSRILIAKQVRIDKSPPGIF